MAVTTGPPLYPGSSTFPGSTTYPGGGDFPQVEVLYSTDDGADATPGWQYVTPGDLRGYTVDRGRNTELDTIDAGTCTVTLSNRSRAYDPNTNPLLGPMNRWWIRTKYGGVTEDRFVGYADRYALQWPERGKDSTVVVSCTDELKVLALQALAATNPPRDTYRDVVLSDEPAGYWPVTDPAVTPTSLWQIAGDSVDAFASDPTTTMTSYVDNPIVGEPSPTGYASASVDAAYLSYSAALATSRDNSLGDVTKSAGFAAEFWINFQPQTSASFWVLWQSPIDSTLNAKWRIQLETTGAVTGWARNNAGTVFTVTSSVLLANAWHHVVWTLEAGTLKLYVDGGLAGSTAWTAPFNGTLNANATTSMQLLNPTGVTLKMSQIAWYPFSLSSTRVAAHYAAASFGFAAQNTSSRISGLLDSVGSRAVRQLRNGDRAVSTTRLHGQPVLDMLRDAVQAESESAMFYVAKSGALAFLNAGHRTVSPWNTVQIVFDDDGTDLSYLDTDQDLSESFLYNEWNVTRAGGLLQTASDATSISRYFRRSQSLDGLQVVDDSTAAGIATAMLAKYKDPMARIPTVQPNMANPDTCAATLARDLGDKIEIIRRPLGGGAAIDQLSWIQSISEQGVPGEPLRVVFGVSPR